MSLIERAVQKLTGNGTPEHPASVPSHPGAGDAGDRSTVERLVDRIQESTSAADAPIGSHRIPELLRSAAPQPAGRTVGIDLNMLRRRGFALQDGEQNRISQEFRLIKRPLLANAFGKGVPQVRNGRRIMVTSAFPGEGKSFNAINLALSIAAERDHKVLLVDADVAKPSIPRELGIEPGPGLMDWLVDENQDVSRLVMQTNIDKLSILLAGTRHDHATELLASTAMTRLLDQISARYPDRIIVFDSPPLLLTTEARVLASYMGQIVLVVESGGTPRQAVMDALGTIEGCEIVGLILNKAVTSQKSGYGGYGYGYGYGHGST